MSYALSPNRTAAAARVREHLSGGLIVDGDGNQQRLQPHDVAVITPHVEQASAVAARLADLPGVLIGGLRHLPAWP